MLVGGVGEGVETSDPKNEEWIWMTQKWGDALSCSGGDVKFLKVVVKFLFVFVKKCLLGGVKARRNPFFVR